MRYFVFSAYYETNLKFGNADFYLVQENFPKKIKLKELVKEKIPNIINVCIMSINELSEADFKQYWF